MTAFTPLADCPVSIKDDGSSPADSRAGGRRRADTRGRGSWRRREQTLLPTRDEVQCLDDYAFAGCGRHVVPSSDYVRYLIDVHISRRGDSASRRAALDRPQPGRSPHPCARRDPVRHGQHSRWPADGTARSADLRFPRAVRYRDGRLGGSQWHRSAGWLSPRSSHRQQRHDSWGPTEPATMRQGRRSRPIRPWIPTA